MNKHLGFVLPSPTLIMAGAIIALSLSNALFIHLYRGAVDDLTEFKTQVAAASAKADADNQARLDAAIENTGEVARIYSAVSDRVRSEYRSRLDRLQRDCAGQAVSYATGTATRPDADAQEPAAGSGTFEAVCFETERNAAADALQLIWLQDWVKKVCK